MTLEYEIYTTIPRNFDPDIEGDLIDNIIETTKGYIGHSVPLRTKDGNTVIRIKTKGYLDKKYIRDQLDSEFGNLYGDCPVVKRIRKIL